LEPALVGACAGNAGAAVAVGLGRFAGWRVVRVEVRVIEGEAPRLFVWGKGRLRGFFFRVRLGIRLEWDIDILEDLARGDAENAVGGFDEVVALAAGVLTAEGVGEGEAGGELLGLDQKASAIGCPWSCFHERRPDGVSA